MIHKLANSGPTLAILLCLLIICYTYIRINWYVFQFKLVWVLNAFLHSKPHLGLTGVMDIHIDTNPDPEQKSIWPWIEPVKHCVSACYGERSATPQFVKFYRKAFDWLRLCIHLWNTLSSTGARVVKCNNLFIYLLHINKIEMWKR